MRTIKISALTLALMVATASDAESKKKLEMKPPKSAHELSSEDVSELILFALTLPLLLAELSQRHAILYEKMPDLHKAGEVLR